LTRPLVLTLSLGLLLGLAACGGDDGDLASIATRASGPGPTNPPASRPDSPAATVGVCFDAPGFRTGAPVDIDAALPINCQQLHDEEVFAVVNHTAPPGTAYPGDDAVRSYALDVCLDAFEPYVGTPYGESSLDFNAVWPTGDQWGSGDRRIVCFLYDADFQKLQLSMKGMGQ
jgi:hypothetical protein